MICAKAPVRKELGTSRGAEREVTESGGWESRRISTGEVGKAALQDPHGALIMWIPGPIPFPRFDSVSEKQDRSKCNGKHSPGTLVHS